MKIVIIEDEKLTAKDLEQEIVEVAPEAEVVAILYSVKQGIEFFRTQPEVNLIFSDIQLGDGLSFDIFDQVSVSAPIIFCTAYDEYALNAFQQNGIDYVLKPFTTSTIKAALDKFTKLTEVFKGPSEERVDLRELIKTLRPTRSSSILVYYKEKIIPINIDKIAVFYIEHQATYLLTFDGQRYFLNKTLDQLEEMVGDSFFRANRQFLISRKAVEAASHHRARKFSVRLNIPLDQSITVSKEKLTAFLAWLERE